MDKYIKRLTEEWMKHGKIIVACDFDSTISPWKTIENMEDIERTISLLKTAQETGIYLVIFTACSSDRYDYIERYCDALGLQIHGINKNPIDLPYGNTAKMYANIFLDDRAGLTQSLDILENSLYKVRGHLQTEKLKKLDDIA